MKIERLAMLTQWGVALGILTLVAASPAAAQLAPNSKAPVDVSADSLEVVNAQCMARPRPCRIPPVCGPMS